MDFLAFANFNPWCKTPTPLPNKGLHSSAVVLGRPGLKAMQPTLSMDALSCVAATLAGSALAIMKKTKQRPNIVRHAKDVPPPVQQSQPDDMKLLSSQPSSEITCSACGCGNSEAGNSRRHISLLAAALVAPSVGSSNAAYAEQITLSKDQCLYCGGVGTTQCTVCQGSGNMQMQGVRNGNPEASYMFATCPICEGTGDEICARCFGSGLPNRSLRGFLKDPAFQKAVYYMRVFKKKRDGESLKKLQIEARAAAIVVENKRKGKKVEAEKIVEAEKTVEAEASVNSA